MAVPTRSTPTRRIRWPVALPLLAVLAVVACGTPAVPAASPSTTLAPASPGSAPAASQTVSVASSPTATPLSRAGDLAFLLERLTALHPDPFVGESPAAFEARVDDLAARADALSDDQFLVEVMRLLGARDRDGHTGLVPFAQGDRGLTAWPLALYEFEEGLRVVDAMAPHEDTIGLRVVEIGGRPIEEVAAAVMPLVSRDNEWTVRARLPGYLVVPEVLRGLGLLPDGAPALTLEDADGRRTELTPSPVPIGEWVEWRNLFYPLVPLTLPHDDDGPRYLRQRGESFWSEMVGDALYVGYRQVTSRTASGETISGLATSIRTALEEGQARRVVVDIRGNPGGDNFTYGPLRDALRRQAEAAPGSVVILIGRSTFSAAGNFATELAAVDGIRFVGEPTGAAPNLWGDAREVRLPHSGLVVHIATRTWEFAPDDDGLAVEPDERIPVRWSDYAAGTDAALEAALAD